MEVRPGVHRIEFPLGDRINSAVLFVGTTGALLFDTGVRGDIARVTDYLDEHRIPRDLVRWVVVSHCDVDHFGGAADAVAAFLQAEVLAHPLDAGLIRDFDRFENERARWFRRYGMDEDPAALAWMREVAETAEVGNVDGGTIVDLGGRTIEIVHLPGHSHGHLAIHDPGNSVFAISDAILGFAVTRADGTPAFPPTYRYVDDYLASIGGVRSRKPGLVLGAHLPPLEGAEGTQFLDESELFVQKLESAISRFVSTQDGSFTLEQVCLAVSPQVGQWPHDSTTTAMAFPVAGHLERMLDRGDLVETNDASGYFLWRAA